MMNDEGAGRRHNVMRVGILERLGRASTWPCVRGILERVHASAWKCAWAVLSDVRIREGILESVGTSTWACAWA